jgi:hypothetical protein
MGRQTIKGVTSELLGSIEINPNGAERAYDVQGRILGSYDPQTNATKAATDVLLAKGNARSGLIFKTCE